MAHSKNLQDSIGIIGAGVAGLINAHVLLQDGFTDVTLISRDKSVGGTWARARVYPGLHINKYDKPFFFSKLLTNVDSNQSASTESIVFLLLKCLHQKMESAVSQVLTCAIIWRSSLKNSWLAKQSLTWKPKCSISTEMRKEYGMLLSKIYPPSLWRL